jgi:hypothetical protein
MVRYNSFFCKNLPIPKEKLIFQHFPLGKPSFVPAISLSAFHLPLALTLASLFFINTYFSLNKGACGPDRQGTELSAEDCYLVPDIPINSFTNK